MCRVCELPNLINHDYSMGQTYSNEICVKVRNENEAVIAIKLFMANKKNTDFRLDYYKEQLGVDVDSFHGLLQVVYGGWNGKLTPFKDKETGYDGFYSDFDACYGWESVMTSCFAAMAPCLEDGSWLRIYPDNDYDLLKVENGTAVWIH